MRLETTLLSALGATALLTLTPMRSLEAAFEEEVAVPSIERNDARFDKLIPPGARLEVVAEGFQWVEGPVWDRREKSLLVSDVPKNSVFRWREGNGKSLFLERSGYTGSTPFTGPEPGSNGLLFDSAGRLVLCEHGDRRVAVLMPDGTKRTLADRFEGKRLNSPNDAVFKSNGDLYFTDPPFGLPGTYEDANKELPFSGVYCLSNDGRLTVLTKELKGPNGIGFSPDERTLYVSNNDPARPVWMAYEVRKDGTIAKGRVFADATPWAGKWKGLPDGLKVDRDGNVFGAGPGGIYVFAPDGTHLGTIRTGVATGNCAFGEDGSALFIASSNTVYRVRTATKGVGF